MLQFSLLPQSLKSNLPPRRSSIFIFLGLFFLLFLLFWDAELTEKNFSELSRSLLSLIYVGNRFLGFFLLFYSLWLGIRWLKNGEIRWKSVIFLLILLSCFVVIGAGGPVFQSWKFYRYMMHVDYPSDRAFFFSSYRDTLYLEHLFFSWIVGFTSFIISIIAAWKLGRSLSSSIIAAWKLGRSLSSFNWKSLIGLSLFTVAVVFLAAYSSTALVPLKSDAEVSRSFWFKLRYLIFWGGGAIFILLFTLWTSYRYRREVSTGEVSSRGDRALVGWGWTLYRHRREVKISSRETLPLLIVVFCGTITILAAFYLELIFFIRRYISSIGLYSVQERYFDIPLRIPSFYRMLIFGGILLAIAVVLVALSLPILLGGRAGSLRPYSPAISLVILLFIFSAVSVFAYDKQGAAILQLRERGLVSTWIRKVDESWRNSAPLPSVKDTHKPLPLYLNLLLSVKGGKVFIAEKPDSPLKTFSKRELDALAYKKFLELNNGSYIQKELRIGLLVSPTTPLEIIYRTLRHFAWPSSIPVRLYWISRSPPRLREEEIPSSPRILRGLWSKFYQTAYYSVVTSLQSKVKPPKSKNISITRSQLFSGKVTILYRRVKRSSPPKCEFTDSFSMSKSFQTYKYSDSTYFQTLKCLQRDVEFIRRNSISIGSPYVVIIERFSKLNVSWLLNLVRSLERYYNSPQRWEKDPIVSLSIH